METTFTNYDPANYLNTEEDIQAYLQVSFEEEGIEGFQKALGVVSRARGMTSVAKESGLGRQNLYSALSENAHPKFETINKVVEALGLRFTLTTAN